MSEFFRTEQPWVDNSDFERVRYVLQRFFESVTNETVVREGGRFYGEIKKAVFSHIADSDRLGCSNLDELIELRTKEKERGLKLLRQQLKTGLPNSVPILLNLRRNPTYVTHNPKSKIQNLY
jgi:hypothetical protein